MSHFPPFPPSQPGPYSNPNRGYGDRPPFPPTIPSGPPGMSIPPPMPQREYPPYPFPTSAPPPPPQNAYRTFDSYGNSSSRPPYRPYEQPSSSFEDHYDPYQPAANVYTSAPPPPMRFPPTAYPQPTMIDPPRPAPSRQSRPISPPRRSVPAYSRPAAKLPSGPPDLTISTNPTTVSIGGFTAAVHSLPPRHLPITKYISLNRDDAMDLHRQLCSIRSSVWYADGASRAGEAWSAAVEWRNDSDRTGNKMRGFIIGGDNLESELGGIFKAAEGFKELLHQSIKDGVPISHDLTVFCDSQAAIVAIDTCSRPEALKFDQLWREICSEYLQAHLTLVWIPKGSGVEPHTLADKIATVGASNSYSKRRKERSLPDIYTRPGTGETEPSASSEPGPWQRGDAEPSYHKEPFERPGPASPLIVANSALANDANDLRLDLHGNDVPTPDQVDGEDEGIQPREGAVFVTHFPPEASAKDIGILFAQYGEIVAVDIFHISPSHPRFANVTYRDPASGLAAIRDLHLQPIKLDTPFALSNQADLEVWRNWGGQLTAVLHEPPRVVPSTVEADFPDLPDWARGLRDTQRNEEEETMEVEGQIKEERSPSPDGARRKRDRDGQDEQGSLSQSLDLSSSTLDESSPSSAKKARHEGGPGNSSNGGTPTAQSAPVDDPAPDANAASDIAVASEVASDDINPTVVHHASLSSGQGQSAQSTVGSDSQKAAEAVAAPPPSLATLRTDLRASAATPPSTEARDLLPAGNSQNATESSLPATAPVLPPTPLTAQQPMIGDLDLRTGSSRQSTAEPASSNSNKTSNTTSASEPQENPIKIGAKTLRAHINLVRSSLSKHEPDNWIAHSCLIAHDIDHARRALQADLYATDECFITGRDLERTLATRGFTAARVDTFISKVLKVLDGIAAAEEPESDALANEEDVERLEAELSEALNGFPNETKDALASAGKILEYLIRGKDLQEKKRLEVERRVKVLEGMVKIGEVVGGVVRYLLTEAQ